MNQTWQKQHFRITFFSASFAVSIRFVFARDVVTVAGDAAVSFIQPRRGREWIHELEHRKPAWFIGHVPGSTSLQVQRHFCQPIRLWDLFRVWFEARVKLWVIFILCHSTESLSWINIQAFFWRDHFIRWTDLATSTELIKYGKQKLKHAWEQTNRWTKGSEQSLHVCICEQGLV